MINRQSVEQLKIEGSKSKIKMEVMERGLIDDSQKHEQECECRLCEKEKQIEEMRNSMRVRFSSTSIYRRSFSNNKSSSRSKQRVKLGKSKKGKQERENDKNDKRKQRQKNKKDKELDLSITPEKSSDLLQKLLEKRLKNSNAPKQKVQSRQYLQTIQSTYLKQYHEKKADINSYKPQDNLRLKRSSVPISTTYLQSYHSTLTPRPDQPMKAFQMPLSDKKLPFTAQSTYNNSFKAKNSKKTLPIIHSQNLHLSKPLGKFQSTQRDSYRSLQNPQKSEMIKPSNTIVQLPAFVHNYDTTYRNMFMNTNRKKQNSIYGDFSREYSKSKHNINQLGIIYNRNKKKNLIRQHSISERRAIYKKI